MEGTRLQILSYLQHQDAPIAGLTDVLGMAPATIRRHLDILQRDGFVSYRAMRRKQGRPEHFFFLTDAGQEVMPKRYDLLLHRILGEMQSLEDVVGERPAGLESEMLLARIARRIASEYATPDEESVGADRVQLLVRALEAEGFAPRVEQEAGELRVHLENCPFRGVAIGNPAVCALDRELIANLLGTPVGARERIDRGDHRCTYTALLRAESADGVRQQ